ncbi:MAG: M17 family peptidase N-terminal domain-containing protein [Nocardioidaceae bacterium]
MREGADSWLNEVGVDPVALLARARAQGTGGEAVSLEIFNHPEVELLLLVGLGQGSSRDMRRAGATVARTAQPRGKAAVALGSITEPDQLGAFVEGLVLGPFGFDRTSLDASDGASERKIVEIQLTGLDLEAFGRTVADATTIGLASWQARYCSITPSNEKSPQQLESWASELVEPAGLQLEVWDDARLAAEGFGGIIAVGAASSYDSRFLRLDYVPGGSRGKKDVPRRFRRRNTGGLTSMWCW